MATSIIHLSLSPLEKLKKSLSGLLSTPDPTDDLISIYKSAVTSGSFESYKLVAAEMFSRIDNPAIALTIEESILAAIKKRGQLPRTEHIVMNILRLRNNRVLRENLLKSALEAAARENNVAVAKCILQEEFPICFLQSSILLAARENSAKMLTLLVKTLVEWGGVDVRTLVALFGFADGSHPDIAVHIDLHQLSILTMALEICVAHKSVGMQTILLATWSDYVRKLTKPAPGLGNTPQEFNKFAVEEYGKLSRVNCLKLFCQRIPDNLRCSISERLKFDGSRSMNVSLSTGGEVIKAHSDVLVYWSPYFGRKEHDLFSYCFDGKVPVRALRAVVEFMYTGGYPDPKTGDREEVLQGVFNAAKYF
ncbi:hypothetical protein BDW59DRAFT_167778 [Aspergillus cavernicola]|uniref:BTB domain-containing protein n=1 Tax=Aspergillus cavernicola TaxID=176166 RepID=A0ABR4HBG1_9EURO